MSKPKLTYFSSRGLIEPLRLLLADAGADYEKNDLGAFSVGNPPPAFLALKASGILDYGSIPVWEEEGFTLVQSASIVRHVARRYGYNGDNEYEAAKIDSIVEGSKDFIQALRKSANAPPDQKAQAWKDTVAVDIPKWLGFFESILKKNGSDFLVGKKVSYADFYVAYNTEELKGVGIDLSSFPLLSSHFSMIYERPNVAAYVNSPSRYPSVFKNLIPK